MTGFIIFAIVLTLAYVLYFAAMITTDLAALKKAAETEEENIDIGTANEEVDEFATQNVVEDPSTGGFNFVSSQQKEEDAATEIAEAEEQLNDDDALHYDDDNSSEANSEQAQDDDSHSEAEETNLENQEQELEDNEEPEEDLDEAEPENEPIDEESGGFEVHDFSEQEEGQETEQKSFKEDDAFDPSLRQKKYDVKNVFEPSASPEVNGHANTVNAALESITTKSVCLTSTGLLSAVRNHTADRYNIDYNHVQTKF